MTKISSRWELKIKRNSYLKAHVGSCKCAYVCCLFVGAYLCSLCTNDDALGVLYWHHMTQFFFKATLLYQVDDLLKSIRRLLNYANELVGQLEKSIAPVLKELNELQGKIKSMEHVEEISQQVQMLKKKLAWSWVYDVDKQLEQEAARIVKLKDRIPACQGRIDRQLVSN